MNEILKAINFASKAHKNQVLKGSGEPYIVHPVRVYLTLRGYYPFNYEMHLAAILHDVIEDTDYSKVDIHAHFGSKVADLVQELTNEYEKKYYPDWNRKKRKAAEFERISKISDEAKIIKLIDRIDNLNDRMNGGFMKKYLQESAALADVLRGVDEILEKILDKQIEVGYNELLNKSLNPRKGN